MIYKMSCRHDVNEPAPYYLIDVSQIAAIGRVPCDNDRSVLTVILTSGQTLKEELANWKVDELEELLVAHAGGLSQKTAT